MHVDVNLGEGWRLGLDLGSTPSDAELETLRSAALQLWAWLGPEPAKAEPLTLEQAFCTLVDARVAGLSHRIRGIWLHHG